MSDKTERQSKESELGCRYSALLELPYFDPVRMLMIDPMHNLFLGSAKHVTRNIWIARGVLSSEKLEVVHKRLQGVQLPAYLGRFPTRIESGSTFTAEQWMNWTLYYSVYCLHGLLSSDEMECWRHFVLACRRLCKARITEDDVRIADGLFLLFCKRIKRIYGCRSITPNMHMHCHLADCVKDYGPAHSFWVFSFERYNGLLGNQPNNNRSIEMQLLRRFLRDNSHLGLLHALDSDSLALRDVFGSVVTQHAQRFSSSTASDEITAEFIEPPKSTLISLSATCVPVLKRIYATMYPAYQQAIEDERTVFPSTVRKFKYIQIKGKKYSSVAEGVHSKGAHVLAKPFFPFVSTTSEVRVAEVLYFFRHAINIPIASSSQHVSHLFAAVRWPMTHPQRHVMGKPVEVWCKSVYEPSILHGILPVENIIEHTIVAFDKVNKESVLVVISLV